MQSCTQCLGAPFPIRFSDTVRPLHTVDPAKSSDVLQHFFPVRVNIPADLLFIHKFPPPYFFCYNPFYRQAGPSHPGCFRDRKASPAYTIFILCASYWLRACPQTSTYALYCLLRRRFVRLPYFMNPAKISFTILPSAFPFTSGIKDFMIFPLSFAVGASIPSSARTFSIVSLIWSSVISAGANS